MCCPWLDLYPGCLRLPLPTAAPADPELDTFVCIGSYNAETKAVSTHPPKDLAVTAAASTSAAAEAGKGAKGKAAAKGKGAKGKAAAEVGGEGRGGWF